MKSEKALLRDEMKALRAGLADRGERDRLIFLNFFSLPEVAAGQTFFVYRSFGTEAGTSRIIEELLRRGKRVYLPRVCGREMCAAAYTGQSLACGAFGIEEPAGEPYTGTFDVCAVPLLAADKRLCRLGYGGGYYDRFFAREESRSFRAGVCYDAQLINTIPAEEHDARLDALVTEARILRRGETEES